MISGVGPVDGPERGTVVGLDALVLLLVTHDTAIVGVVVWIAAERFASVGEPKGMAELVDQDPVYPVVTPAV